MTKALGRDCQGILVLFWCLKNSTICSYSPLSCKEVWSGSIVWGGQISGSILQSVALFLKEPFFCFLGCLKEVAKPYFQDLKAFWCKIWKLLIAVAPILYSIIKNALCRPTWMHNVLKIYWQCCFTFQPDNLGPEAPNWCIHWCTQNLNSMMHPLMHPGP